MPVHIATCALSLVPKYLSRCIDDSKKNIPHYTHTEGAHVQSVRFVSFALKSLLYVTV